MKPLLTLLMITMLSGLPACTLSPAESALPAKEPAQASTVSGEQTPSRPVLKTKIGDFYVLSARFVDEVHGETPEPGFKIMLVGLERVDGKEISLEDFQVGKEVSIKGEDGSTYISPMAGYVGKGFVMGFRLPETVKTYQLIWPGYPPISIVPIHP